MGSVFSIAVIGSGVVGAAIAQRLAEQGVAVLLLDGADPGMESNATAASLGAVTAREQTPRAFFDLCRAAMEDCRRLAWKFAPAPWYHAEGSLAWFEDPERASALKEQVQRLQGWGYAAENLSARVVLSDLEPGITCADPDTAVAWFAEEAWVDAPALTRRLIEAVRNAGGRVLIGPERGVVAIGTADGRVSDVTLRGGQTLPVDCVVNAAGAEAAAVAALVGRQLSLLTPRGMAVRAEMADGRDPLRRPVRTDGIAIRPDGPGRVLLVPAEALEEAPLGSLPVDDARVMVTMARGAEVVPALASARPVAALVADWPLLADGLPSVGVVGAIPGYVEAVTDYGVTLASLIARSLAEEIGGRPGNPLLEPFRPGRPAAS